MPAKPWQPDEAEVREVLERSDSVTGAARELGVYDGTLRKWCHAHGIDTSALADSGMRIRRKAGLDSKLSPAERVERDLDLERERRKRRGWEELYKEARSQLDTYGEIETTLAERHAEPLPAPVYLSAPTPKPGKRLPAREAVLQISDWQIGELVRRTDTGGVNEYNWAVFERRWRRWLDGVLGNLELQLHSYRIPRLVFAFGGDMVEGHDVYKGQAWHLDKDAALQVIDGAPIFAAGIRLICEVVGKRVPTIDVYCVPGNHGKPGGRAGGATPSTFSFDTLLYEFMRVLLTNCRLREFAVETAGRLLFMAADNVCLMTHGNEVRGWGGFPFYGLDKAHGRLLSELDTVFHFWLLGHWHQSATLPAGRGQRIVNGNAVGANQLTTAAVMGATQPSQNLLYFSREYGLAEQAYIHLAPDEFVRPHIYGREE